MRFYFSIQCWKMRSLIFWFCESDWLNFYVKTNYIHSCNPPPFSIHFKVIKNRIQKLRETAWKCTFKFLGNRIIQINLNQLTYNYLQQVQSLGFTNPISFPMFTKVADIFFSWCNEKKGIEMSAILVSFFDMTSEFPRV